jgi:hypothetical protein
MYFLSSCFIICSLAKVRAFEEPEPSPSPQNIPEVRILNESLYFAIFDSAFGTGQAIRALIVANAAKVQYV